MISCFSKKERGGGVIVDGVSVFLRVHTLVRCVGFDPWPAMKLALVDNTDLSILRKIRLISSYHAILPLLSTPSVSKNNTFFDRHFLRPYGLE